MPSLLAGDSRRRQLLTAALPLLLAFNSVTSSQYKVGDLDSWGTPPPPLPNIYASWALNHHFRISDSLLFLYPPSQDSVLQVTERAFNACVVTDPILKMDDGNSIFNITAPGTFYFTSGVLGRCEKRQKLRIAVPDANGTFFPPASGPAGGPAAYPLVFGPTAEEGSGAPGRLRGVGGGGFAVGVVALWCLF